MYTDRTIDYGPADHVPSARPAIRKHDRRGLDIQSWRCAEDAEWVADEAQRRHESPETVRADLVHKAIDQIRHAA